MPASDNSSLCSLMYHPSGAFRRDPVGPEGTGSHGRPGLLYGLKADGLRAARPSRRLRTADGCDDSSPKGHTSATETTDYPHLGTFMNRLSPSGQKVTSRAGNDGPHVPLLPRPTGYSQHQPATPHSNPRPIGRRVVASRKGMGCRRRGSFVLRKPYVLTDSQSGYTR